MYFLLPVLPKLRHYIFTAAEKKLALAYLERGKKNPNLNSLVYQIRRSEKRLDDDLKLLVRVAKKVGPVSASPRGRSGRGARRRRSRAK
jgi:hypothetical protein